MSASIPLSVLDLAPVPSGTAPSLAARRTLDLARLADRLGFARYWFAEHHGMQSVASSAPEILIGYAAAATQRIRVGSGGIMLPNHAPLRVAENFRMLESLHPGRIDLALGRAPGSNRAASLALRAFDGEQFPSMLAELLAFCNDGFPERHLFRSVRAMPDDVPLPPVWLLASSGAAAELAGSSGIGYSFASHFSPMPAAPAFADYRDSFQPSAQFPRPHAILGVAAICADSEEQAQYLATTMDLARLRIARGEFLPLPSPEEALAYPYAADEREIVRQNQALNVVGRPHQVRERIESMARACRADEVMVITNVHSHAERLRSYELLAKAFGLID